MPLHTGKPVSLAVTGVTVCTHEEKELRVCVQLCAPGGRVQPTPEGSEGEGLVSESCEDSA